MAINEITKSVNFVVTNTTNWRSIEQPDIDRKISQVTTLFSLLFLRNSTFNQFLRSTTINSGFAISFVYRIWRIQIHISQNCFWGLFDRPRRILLCKRAKIKQNKDGVLRHNTNVLGDRDNRCPFYQNLFQQRPFYQSVIFLLSLLAFLRFVIW